MKQYKLHKVFELPTILIPDSIYYIKVGQNFEEVITDGQGNAVSSNYITGIDNITQIPNRDYADLTGKPDLSNLPDWDQAVTWGNFRDYGLAVITPQGVGIPGGNLNSTTIPNGFYKITTSTVNSPVSGQAGTVIVERSGLDNYITQKVQIVNSGDVVRSYIRHYKPSSGTWTPWRRLWTTEDFTATQVSNWDATYGWGNHAIKGYLTQENDPVFSASPAGSITTQNKTNWNSAFGWGNHAIAGYLTSLPVHNHDTHNDLRYVKKSGDVMTGSLGIGTTPSTGKNTLLHLRGTSAGVGDGQTRVLLDNTNIGGTAFYEVSSSSGAKVMMQSAGSNYFVPSFAGIVTENTDLAFSTNGDTASGGTDNIIFSPGGYANVGMKFTHSHRLGIGAASLNPTEQLEVDNNILAASFKKRGGTSTQFLMADGSVNDSGFITEADITVVDTNTSTLRNHIATVQGTELYETIGQLVTPELINNVLHIKYKDGDGVIQSQSIDLGSLTTQDTEITNATYDAATNIITLTESNGDVYNIDLSELRITTSTDAAGIITVNQEVDGSGNPITKFKISKVGNTGMWGDILGKPNSFLPSPHHHDGDYVKKDGDTMTGELILTGSTFGEQLHVNRTSSANTAIKYTNGVDNSKTYYAGFNISTGDFGVVNGVTGFNSASIRLNAISGETTANKYIKTGGTETQFLMADGSVSEIGDVTGDYVKKSGDTMTGPLTIGDISTPGQTVFDIQGSAGQLFSIVDSLEGDLFGVNDISGIPIFTVNSEDLVTVDGTLDVNGTLGVNGVIEVKSVNKTGLTTDSTLTTLNKGLYDAAHFNYVVKGDGSLGMRTGTVMAVWDGTDVEFTDTSTNSLGGLTEDIKFSVDISDNNLNLKTIISGGTWSVKVATHTL